MRIPAGLDWWRDEPGGAEWLDRLPRPAEECAGLWSLRLGEPFEPASVSLVVPAELSDGTDAVLKLNFPEPESEREADALELWRGGGAVRLLDHDAELRALLLERCEPGTPLWHVEAGDEANRIAAGVLRRLWRTPPAGHSFHRLDLLASELGLDRERMRRWGIAHALAWGVSDVKLEPDLIECARLLRP